MHASLALVNHSKFSFVCIITPITRAQLLIINVDISEGGSSPPGKDEKRRHEPAESDSDSCSPRPRPRHLHLYIFTRLDVLHLDGHGLVEEDLVGGKPDSAGFPAQRFSKNSLSLVPGYLQLVVVVVVVVVGVQSTNQLVL